MNHLARLGTLLLFAGTLQLTAAEKRPTQPMREATTHDALSQSLRMVQQKDPVRNLGPAIGKSDEDPSKAYAGRDLIKDSAILCYRGFLTLVPKRAVLHLPDKLKDRFEVQENVKVQTWKDFYQTNRGWIRTVEVTREQAMGQSPMPEEIVAAFENSTAAVIATFKGGPISVLPYVAPVEEGAGDPAAGESKPVPAEDAKPNQTAQR